jgi:hypothetical protein
MESGDVAQDDRKSWAPRGVELSLLKDKLIVFIVGFRFMRNAQTIGSEGGSGLDECQTTGG